MPLTTHVVGPRQSLGLSEFISFDQMIKDTVDQFIKLGVVTQP